MYRAITQHTLRRLLTRSRQCNRLLLLQPTRPFTCCSRLLTSSPPSVDSLHSSSTSASIQTEQPRYQLTFTCKKCSSRSSHELSKQAYHHGTVLVQCPGCKNRHLIADHLKIFSDTGITLDDILKTTGEIVRKKSISVDQLNNGDMEWIEKGSEKVQKS